MANFNPQFEKIGNILIHEGYIEETQLTEALEEQKIKKDNTLYWIIKFVKVDWNKERD